MIKLTFNTNKNEDLLHTSTSSYWYETTIRLDFGFMLNREWKCRWIFEFSHNFVETRDSILYKNCLYWWWVMSTTCNLIKFANSFFQQIFNISSEKIESNASMLPDLKTHVVWDIRNSSMFASIWLRWWLSILPIKNGS